MYCTLELFKTVLPIVVVLYIYIYIYIVKKWCYFFNILDLSFTKDNP